MRVLVTGACGWTAEAIVAALDAAGHEVIGLDLPGVPCSPAASGALRSLARGSVEDLAVVEAAVTDVDAVVHLAVTIGEGAYERADRPFAVNVFGTYTVFEAARRARLDAVVLLSSASVHLPPAGPPLDARRDWRSSPGGDHLYDLTKRLQEEIARDYAETFGMTAVVVRAGHIVDGRASVDAKGRPLRDLLYCRGGWVCRYDVAAACVHALALDRPGYSTFHVIGARAAAGHFDIDRTERELGVAWTARFEAYE